MARFYGNVGYGSIDETDAGSGVWEDELIERSYYGDVIRNARSFDNSDSVTGQVTISNTISIVADEYAYGHFHDIKYVRWAGVYWTVTSVEVQHPRLLLRIGEVYNGPKA